ncbi:hypothetical protein PVA44_05520 [Entomospira nematocerorum]|uniref:HhH-GPD domain-containing protein n=1 Tax=Entomospira nematocerorum TaxID=2719987 RepID=A0A968GAX4_9SPIO|nr:hypothetical protein [Entomospira nematocera]NIZ46522.1 hypothetical protein [Entomospira nematocera]WDI33679.1 hypothetical protein PVA44_05520 [Entomospira nematocera]
MQELIDWFQSLEPLPWQNDRDPYKVYILEIMSQQTTLSVMMKRYPSWISTFPSIDSIAAASEEDVLLAWEGLGYYQRARNIYTIAKFIKEHGFPEPNLSSWLQLPGVGRYTAAAILSRAYNKPYLAVDVNVKRIIMRIFGVSSYDQGLEEKFIALLGKNLFDKYSSDMNQGLIRLGQSLCKKKEIICKECPLMKICKSAGNISCLNVSTKKTIERRDKYLVIISFNEYIYIEKIESGVGKNMYRLPLVDYELWQTFLLEPGASLLSKRKHSYTKYCDYLYPLYIEIKEMELLQRFDNITKHLIACNKKKLHERPFLSSYRIIIDELLGGGGKDLFLEDQ